MRSITDRRTFTAAIIGAVAMPALAAKPAKPKTVPQPDPALWHIDTSPTNEGFAPGPNGPVYYRIYGRPGGTPVIVLHGGPAAGETYMRPYAGLAKDRQVVLYDQSGCGRSARPSDMSLYTVDSYVSELDALQSHLGFKKVILLGHSWGGFLAPSYAASFPERVEALVLAGSATSMQDFAATASASLKEFGPEAVATVARNTPPPAVPDPRYEELTYAYYQRHLLRIDPWPEFVVKGGTEVSTNPVYIYMNGPSEFQFTGSLANIDVSSALRALRIPVLITCGEFDEAPGWVAEKIRKNVRNARVEVFAGLSHMSHIEDPTRVISTTGRFLRGV